MSPRRFNGVARIHSEILKNDLFKDWYRYYPERFQNKTNGITPRRWLGLCNPELCGLIESKVGTGFLTDLDKLEGLKNGLDEMTVKQFNAIKLEKKRQLCAVIEEREGVKLDPSFVFDVQVKRLHEYKRQLMNALSIMDLYFGIKDGTISDFTPTAFIFGAKAAPRLCARKGNHPVYQPRGGACEQRPGGCGQDEGCVRAELQLLVR